MSGSWFITSIEHIESTIQWLFNNPNDLEYKKPEAAMLISRQLLSLMVEMNEVSILDSQSFSSNSLSLSSEQKKGIIGRLEDINTFVQKKTLLVSTQDYSNHSTHVNMPYPANGGYELDSDTTSFLEKLFTVFSSPVPSGNTPDYFTQGLDELSNVELQSNIKNSCLFRGIQSFYDVLEEIPAYHFGNLISVMIERICAGLKVSLNPDFFSSSFFQVALSVFNDYDRNTLVSHYDDNLKGRSFRTLRKKATKLSDAELLQLTNEEIRDNENLLLESPYSDSFAIFLASDETDSDKVALIKALWQKDDNEKYLSLLQYNNICKEIVEKINKTGADSIQRQKAEPSMPNPIVDAIREQTEAMKQTAEVMMKVATKPTSIGQLNMGNGKQELPPSTNIPSIEEQ